MFALYIYTQKIIKRLFYIHKCIRGTDISIQINRLFVREKCLAVCIGGYATRCGQMNKVANASSIECTAHTERVSFHFNQSTIWLTHVSVTHFLSIVRSLFFLSFVQWNITMASYGYVLNNNWRTVFTVQLNIAIATFPYDKKPVTNKVKCFIEFGSKETRVALFHCLLWMNRPLSTVLSKRSAVCNCNSMCFSWLIVVWTAQKVSYYSLTTIMFTYWPALFCFVRRAFADCWQPL